MRKSKIWIIVGSILLFGAFGLTIHNYYEDYQAKENADNVVQKLAHVMKKEDTSSLYKMNPDIEMPTKTIDGIKYIGVLEVPELSLQPGWIKNCTRKIQRKCLQKKYHHCRS